MNFPENPYSAPECEWQPDRASAARSVPRLIASTVVCIAFACFTSLLMESGSSDDKAAGQLYLFNVPVLIGMVFSAIWSPRISVWLGLLSVAIQVAITARMLALPIGSPQPVIIINSVVLAPLVGLTIWSWFHYKATWQG